MGLFDKLLGTIEQTFKIGLNGAQLKSEATNVMQVRNNDDSANARLQILAAVNDSEAVTLKQLNTASKPTIIDDQADTSVSLPTNTGAQRTLVVTTAGSGAAIGDLLYDDGSGSGSMEILPAVEGQVIAITDALSGGSIAFDADSIYIWDADGTAWVKIGDIGSATGGERVVEFDISTGASQASTFSIPANASVYEVYLEIDTAYDPGATIEIGRTGDTDLLMTTSANNPQGTVGDIYKCTSITDWGGSSLPVLVSVGGSPSAGAGTVVVKFATPNA